MRRMLMFVLSLLFGGALFAADPAAIVQSERSFSRLAGEKGVRTAFLHYLADDSVVFDNGPVNGKKFYEARPDSPGILYWMPIASEISAAGDMGYTTGPWEFRTASMEEKPVAYGTFASIWKKQTDGGFKVIVDLGAGYPSSTFPVASLEKIKIATVSAGKTLNKLDAEKEKAALIQVDRDMSKLSEQKGAAAVYDAWATDGIRIVRDGTEPIVEKEKVKAAVQSQPGTRTWEPAAAGISASGDLGYTYGVSTLKDTAPKKGDYLHVWKRQPDGKWKLVLDVISTRKE